MHKLLSIDLSSESRFSSINIPLVDESLVNSYIVIGGEWSKLQLNPYFKFWKVVKFHSFQRIWTPVQRRIPFATSFKFIEEVEPSRLGICVQTIRRFLVSTSYSSRYWCVTGIRNLVNSIDLAKLSRTDVVFSHGDRVC